MDKRTQRRGNIVYCVKAYSVSNTALFRPRGWGGTNGTAVALPPDVRTALHQQRYMGETYTTPFSSRLDKLCMLTGDYDSIRYYYLRWWLLLFFKDVTKLYRVVFCLRHLFRFRISQYTFQPSLEYLLSDAVGRHDDFLAHELGQAFRHRLKRELVLWPILGAAQMRRQQHLLNRTGTYRADTNPAAIHAVQRRGSGWGRGEMRGKERDASSSAHILGSCACPKILRTSPATVVDLYLACVDHARTLPFTYRRPPNPRRTTARKQTHLTNTILCFENAALSLSVATCSVVIIVQMLNLTP